jgi:LemA protein
MDTQMIVLIIVVLLVVLAIFYYNKLIQLKVRVNESWSDIKVQLKRRHNLIGNLVNTVKGYAKHEAETLEKVVQARNAAKESEEKGVSSIQAAEQKLTSAMQGLNINALAESYPDLKANTNFQQLQSELADTENKIAASRRFYNTTVSSLNTLIQQFPANLFAGLAKAEQKEFFQLDDAEEEEGKKAPDVQF